MYHGCLRHIMSACSRFDQSASPNVLTRCHCVITHNTSPRPQWNRTEQSQVSKRLLAHHWVYVWLHGMLSVSGRCSWTDWCDCNQTCRSGSTATLFMTQARSRDTLPNSSWTRLLNHSDKSWSSAYAHCGHVTVNHLHNQHHSQMTITRTKWRSQHCHCTSGHQPWKWRKWQADDKAQAFNYEVFLLLCSRTSWKHQP